MDDALRGACAWLLKHAGPAIRYQTLKLLPDADGAELADARTQLEACGDTARLLAVAAHTARQIGFQNVHGGRNYHLENVLPMLLDRGLDAAFPAFDAIFRPMLGDVNNPQFPDAHCFHLFMKIIITPFLLEAGYREPWMLDFFHERLDVVSAFARCMDFDLYGDQSGYRGIPKPFRDRPVIKPELHTNGMFRFPLIYDLYAYRAMYGGLDAAGRGRVDDVLRYVTADEYQSLPPHYGLLREGPGHYYAMGWDAQLPRCEDGILTAAALHRLELLAAFPVAVSAPWFKEHLGLLMSYRQEDGTFLLPRAALAEKEMYWVSAGHMALGEERRRREGLRAEGTFRAVRLLARG